MVMTNSTFSHAAKELDEKLDVQLMEGCPSNDISGTMYKILRLFNISILILEAFILCGSFLFHYPELTLPGYFFLGITFLAAVSSFPGWHRLFFNLCFGRLYADALSTNLKSPVTFRNGQKTEGGYLFEYDCCCSDIQLIYRAELYLNKSLSNRYELQLTNEGLSLTQTDRKNFYHR